MACLLVAGLGTAGSASSAAAAVRAIVFAPATNEIAVTSSLSATPRVIANTGGLNIAVSPDGRTVAFVNAPGLELLNLTTGTTTTLSRAANGRVEWSPDSSRLLVEAVSPSSLDDDLLVCTRAPAACRTVARAPINGYAFSPDGHSVAYDDVDTEHVVILGLDGRRRVIAGWYDQLFLWARAGLIAEGTPPSAKQPILVFSLRHDDGRVTRLFTERNGMAFLEPVDVSPNGHTILYEDLVSCGPLDLDVISACLPFSALIETGSTRGGLPGPASSRLSYPSTAAFASDGSVIAAFSATAGAHRKPFPTYLGEQRLPRAGRTPPPPTLTKWRTYGVSLARDQ